MNSTAAGIIRSLRLPIPTTPNSKLGSRVLTGLLSNNLRALPKRIFVTGCCLRKFFLATVDGIMTPVAVMGVQGCSKLYYSASSAPFNGAENETSDGLKNGEADEFNDDDLLPDKSELQLQGVDPRKGWNFRGVHKAIICGKVGQAPLQKILRSGKTVTIFTVGTGGMFDQRLIGDKDRPKPAQWHRIAVHNEALGAYAVQQLAKNSSVYVEGDIETRVYNDSINGEVKNIPEICVRRDGRIRLFKSGETISSIAFDELREGLLS